MSFQTLAIDSSHPNEISAEPNGDLKGIIKESP